MEYTEWHYRFAEEVLNSKIQLKREIDSAVRAIPAGEKATRRQLNRAFEEEFRGRGWESQMRIFEVDDVTESTRVPLSKIDFFKGRIGVEVAFVHPSFLGTDMLKFQVLSYSNLDKIDAGVYIVITGAWHKRYGRSFDGSIHFEKVRLYLPHYRSAIQVPVWVIGLLPPL